MTENQTQTEVLQSPASQFGNVLYEWSVRNDFSTEKNLNWTAAMLFLEFLFIILSFLTKQWLLAFILIGMALITYIIVRYPARQTQNTITTLGVLLDGKLFKWSELQAFWILQEPIHILLGFETKRRINRDEIVLIDQEDPQKMVEIISKYLPQKEKKIPLTEVLLELIGYKIRLLISNFRGGKKTN